MKQFLSLIQYKHHIIAAFCCILGAVVLQGCKSDRENAFLELTTMEIEDPVRHYYPIIQGLEQNIIVKVTNTGDNALMLYKVLPSCGCTIATFTTHAIAPGSEGFIKLKYDSTKNIGHVGIYTTVLANTKEHSHTIYFDINVVPDALYTKDYEELYQMKREEEGTTQELVEGETNQRGYIIDSTEVQKYK
ncbi:DUF1573 domain-containing protein [Flavobacterium arcticum]|uniref:DUF1573 domain-containing protein n=1 Tax=Flavobacterium arcticum TaxID=1784713 RepID=A0A345HCU4_9FLAO|nr:DUF1573 domain-containing protein [Flavobacterium arcticum]AXG74404.1 DUF1573 domain-containing protein [Flavobacterium arcticum]KAF2512476.1 DUF1573 domain-containing protein [Flavobacterium arcticum]